MTLPFLGETMECALCDAKEQSEPRVESRWTACELSGKRFYVCPAHLPGPSGTRAEFSKAWSDVLQKLIAKGY